MGIIARRYIKDLVHRYDKEIGVPYYSVSDYKDLKQESFSFTNSKGIEIHYFFYYYDNYKKDRLVLFCPGIGPGHVAYLTEIEWLAKNGYKVLTLDYTGCGESKGDNLSSLNMPTLDVMELLDHLQLSQKIVLFGHSLGAYTALNVINLRKEITKAVIMSGFLSIEGLLRSGASSKFILSRILKYEQKMVPQYFNIDNISYLKKTKDNLLFIHSEDDAIVTYQTSMKVVEEINNPNTKTFKLNNKKHNPNYSTEAVQYLNEVFGKYQEQIKNKTIRTDEDKINYFKDVSLEKLTKQDQIIVNLIVDFIAK